MEWTICETCPCPVWAGLGQQVSVGTSAAREGIFPPGLGTKGEHLAKPLWLKMLNKSDPVLPFLDDWKHPSRLYFIHWNRDTESRLQLSAFLWAVCAHHLYCFGKGVYEVLWNPRCDFKLLMSAYSLVSPGACSTNIEMIIVLRFLFCSKIKPADKCQEGHQYSGCRTML